MKKGIVKRWLVNSIIYIGIVLTTLSLLLSTVVMNYYYGEIGKELSNYSQVYKSYLHMYNNSEEDFMEFSKNYIQNFPSKDLCEIVLLNEYDQVVMKASGFKGNGENIKNITKFSKDNSLQDFTVWIGRLNDGEKVIAAIQPTISPTGVYLGSIYYIVSLKYVDYMISLMNLMFIFLFIFAAILIMSYSTYFLNGIVSSVKGVSNITKGIALGKFDEKLEKRYDDEIGDLCDNINYMASELGETEKMKNDFISSVSHELRTPLTAINGWAETMKLGASPATMQKGLGIITNETRRLSNIVEELLDFSNMQNNKMILIPEKLDILAELDDAVYMYIERAIAEKKHLLFEPPETVSPIIGDKDRLRQVFANLIDNALKYSPENSIITVSVQEREDKIYIVVKDNGCGIPEEHLPKITEKFYKVNNTQRGSGIGLAIVDEIVKLHSGNLIIESKEGEGTTVIISLNALKNDEE
ncbi:MAG: HAMP domain-containing sensor histidine kinase [Clostridia bacterium]|nr:HAMP domain-containing sensor histidine kinase [Clostridia bacterium]